MCGYLFWPEVICAAWDDFTILGAWLERIKSLPGWEDSYLVDVATQVGTRESHRIIADHQLTREEVLEGGAFPDAVAQGTYPIDIHTPDGPGITFEYLDGTWKRLGGDRSAQSGRWDGQPAGASPRDTLCYQIPYGSLIPRDLDNVLVAGRCAGANHDSAGARFWMAFPGSLCS